ETLYHRVRKIDRIHGIITTVAGTGQEGFSGEGKAAAFAMLDMPIAATVDSAGNLYIADFGDNRIRRVDAGTGIITTIAGNGNSGVSGDGGPAISGTLNSPAGIFA